ncbi:inhibitor of nuclear factor kappa-B kinase subunit alpha-like isoform X1 [Syngnathoides biaculeatus]|uniref:inhibitor of nuclear factor kappa-B kinase subunit alpha-like isoform X1 n=1 Tax=Syngnathoides biaculeatus TaxID=300417 RepID=UPI002ADD813A|nr:inhibitor of nuclear factor kappa-B kinase subunit alpha-like isoform X1 [Syngnathoides biaculeatus]XP_061693564.1 inhibitor of nuclear factor kappa-B kinase subunit alpha-like isoform X1 [Syngnathoides biaculeatus]
MERASIKQNQLFGPWEMKERLGMGGFGHVYLYQNLKSGKKLAVKICRLELSSKNKERWGREIQIMKKLNHVNVVQASEVPQELSLIALNNLPLLAMEYCSGGDLRKVLSKPENCCGLKESEVLTLLRDIGSGIQYLHENKIIHRDLKPENIVLQEISGELVHKIIDLGYAKDLDQGSVCTSFVGTLQYLAPELFESKPYTVTVDYWSFGTVIFECTCGFRPFLHHMQPVQWTSQVKNKGAKDIMAVEDMNGEIRFSAHLPYPNNLSRPLLQPVENLLQMLLLWDPVARGGGLDPVTSKANCYGVLQNLLNMKVIHVLDMTTAQLHSLVLEAEESLHSLQIRLEKHTQTHISPLNQELLWETGISLDPRRPPAHCLQGGLRGWDTSIVFLFDKSQSKYSGPLTARPLPNSVNFIVRETKTQLPLAALRKVWGEAISYICGLKEDYARLYQGQRAAMLSLLRYNTNLTRCKNQLFSQSQQLQAKLAFFKTSIQYDLEQYTKQRHTGISSEKMLRTWHENEAKADSFTKVADVGYLNEEIVSLHSEIVELQRSPFLRRQGDLMEQLEAKAIELYKQLKLKCKSPDPPHGYSDSSDMVKAILQMVQNQDRVLKDLYTALGTILTCKQRIVDLFPKLEKAVDSIQMAEAAIMQMQTKRQKEFWYLLKIACSQNESQICVQPSSDSESVPQLLDDNQLYLSKLTSLLQDVSHEMEQSIMDQDWSWISNGAGKHNQNTSNHQSTQ